MLQKQHRNCQVIVHFLIRCVDLTQRVQCMILLVCRRSSECVSTEAYCDVVGEEHSELDVKAYFNRYVESIR